MYTIDEFIERLKELRSILPEGGQTPVVIETHDHDRFFENVGVEIQNVVQIADGSWATLAVGNKEQVCKVF
jgi:hypothetical protein